MARKTNTKFQYGIGVAYFLNKRLKYLPIQTNIINNDADPRILSKAKFSPKDESDILGQFQNYHIHHKVIQDAGRAWIMMLVKNYTINITRLMNFEDPTMSCMSFKIITKDSTTVLWTLYREWNNPEEIKIRHL